MRTHKLLVNLTTILLSALAFVLLTLVFSSCGSSKYHIGPIILSQANASAYLAPDSSPEMPTTVRIRIWVWDKNLPISSASIDPDGNGEQESISGDLHEMGKLNQRDGGTNFYFDFEWEGPDETMAEVTIVCAADAYSDDVWLQLDLLPPWPY